MGNNARDYDPKSPAAPPTVADPQKVTLGGTVGVDGMMVTVHPVCSHQDPDLLIQYAWGDIASEVWPSTRSMVQHVYTAPGSYTITMGPADNSSPLFVVTETETFSVTIGTSAPTGPTLPTGPTVPPQDLALTAVFHAAGSMVSVVPALTPITPPSAALRYAWGDGSPATVISAQEILASHTYPTGGTYTVTVAGDATSDPAYNVVGAATGTVTLPTGPAAEVALTVAVRTADLFAAAVSSLTPEAPGGVQVDYDWGDGSDPDPYPVYAFPIYAPVVSHMYPTGGTYTVTVTENAASDPTYHVVGPSTQQITVPGPAPTPITGAAIVQITGLEAAVAPSFSPESPAMLRLLYMWGDGRSDGMVPASTSPMKHTYAAAGSYVITIAQDPGSDPTYQLASTITEIATVTEPTGPTGP